MIARATEQKGIKFVVPFIERVLNSGTYPDVSFVIVSSGDAFYTDALMSLVYRFPGRVGFLNGFAPSPLKERAFLCADLFIAFSTWEPGGISPMEALAFGVPCLVSDKQGHKSTIRTIPVAEFENVFGTEADWQTANGARFPMNERDIETTLKNIMTAFDCLYRLWKNRNIDERWNTIIRNAFTSDNSWEKVVSDVETLFKNAMRDGGNLDFSMAGLSLNKARSISSLDKNYPIVFRLIPEAIPVGTEAAQGRKT